MNPEIILEVIMSMLFIFMGIGTLIGAHIIFTDPFECMPKLVKIILGGMATILGLTIIIGMPLYFIMYNQ